MTEDAGSLPTSVPVLDIASLFGERSAARDAVDAAVMQAANSVGFFVACGLPVDVTVDRGALAALLRIFELGESGTRPLWRQKFAAENPNVYRGWFPLQSGFLTSKEGIDLGADIAHGPSVVHVGDPLREATPLPLESQLPGWRAIAARYYIAMERVGRALMRSIARSLSLNERFFDETFLGGLSTLRLIRYPPRADLEQAALANPGLWVTHQGIRCYITGAPHVDSGFLTLLAQDDVAGLQARHQRGAWLDVPAAAGSLAVNFGATLEAWTRGRINATQHRVIGRGHERRSIPFFYEARAEAEICPLPIDPVDAFEPFFYGDFLWASTTQFVEFHGMEGLRQPRRATQTLQHSRPQVFSRNIN